ncbi:6ff62790-c085-4be5-bd35-a576275e3bcc [Sclerotinia trifoliorum]|uniref:6ff62790-c085-4be5-bd35-a576275e3bcc n=1 Tax=Sclerotinia trifoliorum TaxID=28548 RepID=A0A8H2VWN0_9HELO|nr:6ff62790-c085-4be5-bd35-a576275e3bcc [Sclerotinia trifoliorum]
MAVEIPMFVDVRHVEPQAKATTFFIALSKEWEGHPLRRTDSNNWRLDLKLLVNHNSRHRYYYFYSVDGAKHPYDPKLPWEPISTTNEKLNYFECDFEIVSVISSENTVEGHPLSPSQILLLDQ